MLDIRLTSRFKKDVKRLQKQNKVMRELACEPNGQADRDYYGFCDAAR